MQKGRETGPMLFQRELMQLTGVPVFQAFYNKALLKDRSEVSLEEQMRQLKEYAPEKLIVVPTFLIPGKTWEGFRAQIFAYRGEFAQMRILPAFLEKESTQEALAAVYSEMLLHKKSCCLFIGHGAGDETDRYYLKMENRLQEKGLPGTRFALLHGSPGIKILLDCPEMAWEPGSTVTVIPFLVSTGRHTMEDISGERPDCVEEILRRAGYKPEIQTSGLLDRAEIRRVFCDTVLADCSLFNNIFLNSCNN